MADSIRRTIADTLEYYNTHPVDIAKRYEQVDGGLFLGEMPIWVVNRGKILGYRLWERQRCIIPAL